MGESGGSDLLVEAGGVAVLVKMLALCLSGEKKNYGKFETLSRSVPGEVLYVLHWVFLSASRGAMFVTEGLQPLCSQLIAAHAAAHADTQRVACADLRAGLALHIMRSCSGSGNDATNTAVSAALSRVSSAKLRLEQALAAHGGGASLSDFLLQKAKLHSAGVLRLRNFEVTTGGEDGSTWDTPAWLASDDVTALTEVGLESSLLEPAAAAAAAAAARSSRRRFGAGCSWRAVWRRCGKMAKYVYCGPVRCVRTCVGTDGDGYDADYVWSAGECCDFCCCQGERCCRCCSFPRRLRNCCRAFASCAARVSVALSLPLQHPCTWDQRVNLDADDTRLCSRLERQYHRGLRRLVQGVGRCVHACVAFAHFWLLVHFWHYTGFAVVAIVFLSCSCAALGVVGVGTAGELYEHLDGAPRAAATVAHTLRSLCRLGVFVEPCGDSEERRRFEAESMARMPVWLIEGLFITTFATCAAATRLPSCPPLPPLPAVCTRRPRVRAGEEALTTLPSPPCRGLPHARAYACVCVCWGGAATLLSRTATWRSRRPRARTCSRAAALWRPACSWPGRTGAWCSRSTRCRVPSCSQASACRGGRCCWC